MRSAAASARRRRAGGSAEPVRRGAARSRDALAEDHGFGDDARAHGRLAPRRRRARRFHAVRRRRAHAARAPAAADRAHRPHAARQAHRRARRRPPRRGRLPQAASLEELRAVGVAAGCPTSSSTSCRSRCGTCRTSSPPAWARATLAECLALQLRALPERHAASATRRSTLVTRHLDVLAARDFTRLKRLLGVDEDELREVHALILTLDPKPGRAFGQGDVRYVVPDVRRAQGRGRAGSPRSTATRCRGCASTRCTPTSCRPRATTARKHLAGQLQEARWLIKNVQQRFDTILRVTQAIVDRQQQLLRARRGRDAPARAARDRRGRGAARIHRSRASPRRSTCSPRAASSS